MVSNEFATTKGEWKTATFDKAYMESGSVIDPDTGGVGTIVDTDVFNNISIEIADGWGVITADQVQTVWIKNPTIIETATGTTLMTWFRVPHYYEGCNLPALTVHFVMGYDFAMNAAAGERIVRTDVTYQGIYTQGFTWTP